MAGHFLVSSLNVFIAGIIPFVLVPSSCFGLDTSSPSVVFSVDVFAERCHIWSLLFRSNKAGSFTIFPPQELISGNIPAEVNLLFRWMTKITQSAV